MRLLLRWVLLLTPFAPRPRAAANLAADWAERDPAPPGGAYFDGARVAEPIIDARDPELARAFWALLERWAPARRHMHG